MLTTLPAIDDGWFLINKSLGCNESALVVERLFRYAVHWIYKKYFREDYLIPGWRKMPNSIRREVEILGAFLHSILEICIQIFGMQAAGSYFDEVSDELKRDYLLAEIPSKKGWIEFEKLKRGKLRKSENPFSEDKHPFTWNLINVALQIKDQNDSFRKNQWKQFLDALKLWADNISSKKNWYTKVI